MNRKISTVSKILILISVSFIVLLSNGCGKMEEYATFESPNKKYKIVVMRKTSFWGSSPGQSGDSPGEVRLYNKNGDLLKKKAVEMVQLVEKVEWTEKNVYIKLVADWDLPN